MYARDEIKKCSGAAQAALRTRKEVSLTNIGLIIAGGVGSRMRQAVPKHDGRNKGGG